MKSISKVTPPYLYSMKQAGEKICALTAYEYVTASILDEVGIDIVLIGDSLGMVALGYSNTIPVTVDEMLHHCKAVSKAVKRAMVIADMPFLSYQISIEKALENIGRFLKEGGCHGVKLEGATGYICDLISRCVEIGIPVMGHIGLMPQQVYQRGGFKPLDQRDLPKLITDAKNLEGAGVFSIILETIPDEVAEKITKEVSCPTIGIGAGCNCDGQVLVIYDVLGLTLGKIPKFAKKYADVGNTIRKAVKNYITEVKSGIFPSQY